MKKTKQIKLPILNTEFITGVIMTDRASEILNDSSDHSTMTTAGKEYFDTETGVDPPVSRICVCEEIIKLCPNDGCDY